jgi:hypothetical protein
MDLTIISKIISGFLFGLTAIICINAVLIDIIDKRTMYKHNIHLDYTKIQWLLFSFAFIFIFFQKRIKQYRKDIYFKNQIKIIEWEKENMKEYLRIWSSLYEDEYKECLEYMRYKKLKKIQNKIKNKNKFLKIF